MSDEEPRQSKDILTPEELQGWLAQEIKDSAKAHELRVREAKKLVEEYSSGTISGQEVMDRLHAYDIRWGEALSGASAIEGVSDEAILSAIDRARRTDYRSAAMKQMLGQRRPKERSRG